MNKIIHGDCAIEITNLNENIIDLTCTSPPYFNAKSYSTWKTYDDYLQFLIKVFKGVYRITKEGRFCIVVLSPIIEARKNRNSESKRWPIPFHFFSIMEKIGWKYIDDIIWKKPEGAAINRNGGFFQHRKPVAYKPNLVSETILVFQKPANFLIDKIVRSYDGEILKKSLVKDGYERSNVWEINPEINNDHPAPYPVELSNKIITYYSFVGDLVFDPFLGSGTTAVSCIELERQYLGIEIHKKYVDKIKIRLSEMNTLRKFFD